MALEINTYGKLSGSKTWSDCSLTQLLYRNGRRGQSVSTLAPGPLRTQASPVYKPHKITYNTLSINVGKKTTV